MEYSFFYKKKYESVSPELISTSLKYDLYISAYNESERVQFLFDNVNAPNKHWLIFPEYQFSEIEVNQIAGDVYDYSRGPLKTESQIILDYFDQNEGLFRNNSIAIDITGMLRPHVIYFTGLLKKKGIQKVDFIYSEPNNYKKKEDTEFSIDHLNIRNVDGFTGLYNPETNRDLLIIGSGYDNKRISRIAKEKKEAKKVQVLGFPSLQADMFQQNILKSYKAEEDVSSGEFNLDSKSIILAPANDPFITAQLISDYIKKNQRDRNFTNIYLCPLATKAQTLGMALYYAFEGFDTYTSIIFPFSKKYSRETSIGVARVWVYTVEYSLN